jgi:hypothetical protein
MVADRVGVEAPKIEGALAMGSEGATGADVDDAAAVRIVAELQRVAAAARSIGPRAAKSGEHDT